MKTTILAQQSSELPILEYSHELADVVQCFFGIHRHARKRVPVLSHKTYEIETWKRHHSSHSIPRPGNHRSVRIRPKIKSHRLMSDHAWDTGDRYFLIWVFVWYTGTQFSSPLHRKISFPFLFFSLPFLLLFLSFFPGAEKPIISIILSNLQISNPPPSQSYHS